MWVNLAIIRTYASAYHWIELEVAGMIRDFIP